MFTWVVEHWKVPLLVPGVFPPVVFSMQAHVFFRDTWHHPYISTCFCGKHLSQTVCCPPAVKTLSVAVVIAWMCAIPPYIAASSHFNWKLWTMYHSSLFTWGIFPHNPSHSHAWPPYNPHCSHKVHSLVVVIETTQYHVAVPSALCGWGGCMWNFDSAPCVRTRMCVMVCTWLANWLHGKASILSPWVSANSWFSWTSWV